MTLCGGCAGLGAHRRWCPVHVGKEASRRGKWSEAIEALGDAVGSNNPAAANHLYAAAGLLLNDAKRLRAEFQSPPEGV
jgi:hypothetical protein